MAAQLLIASALLLPYSDQVKAAVDYAAAKPSTRFLDFNGEFPLQRPRAATGLRLMLPHLSRERFLDTQRPVQLERTELYAIDLEGLGWSTKTWQRLAALCPYNEIHDPLILPGPWFLWAVSDSNAGFNPNPYDLLLFNGDIPTNEAQLQERLGARDNLADAVGVIIPRGKSGVSRNTRLLRHDPYGGVAYKFKTFDVFTDEKARDAFANLAGGPKQQAAEVIWALSKIDGVTQERVHCQVYSLLDGQDKIVKFADTRAVNHPAGLFGDTSIRYPGSCLACHFPLNGTRENEVRDAIIEGYEISTKDGRLSNTLAAFYLGSVEGEIAHQTKSYARFIELACGQGITANGAHAAYLATIEGYDDPVTIERASLEHYTTPEVLPLAMAYYSERIGKQGGDLARFSQLAHGKPITRRQYEGGVYFQIRAALQLWGKRA